MGVRAGACWTFAIAFVAVIAAPAAAITYGIPDVVHRNVGAVILDFAGPGAIEWCTGTLVSTRILLTAGHCTRGLDDLRVPLDVVRVSFEISIWEEPARWRPVAAWFTHPAFRSGPASDPHDLGVVVLAEPVTDRSPATLASVGYLDGLVRRGGLRGETFDVVGYGANEYGIVTGYRFVARSLGLSVHGAWLYMSQSVHRGAGGTCRGDSGGPTFHVPAGGFVVAVTSWGDARCVATGIAYRVDTAEAHAFLEAMVSAHG